MVFFEWGIISTEMNLRMKEVGGPGLFSPFRCLNRSIINKAVEEGIIKSSKDWKTSLSNFLNPENKGTLSNTNPIIKLMNGVLLRVGTLDKYIEVIPKGSQVTIF